MNELMLNWKIKRAEIKMKAKIKERVNIWLLETDFHGLPNMTRSNLGVIKIIWAVCFCLSSAVCSFLLIRSIKSYFDFEVFSKYDVIFEETPLFPTVSICNINPFVTEASINYTKKLIEEHNITLSSFFDPKIPISNRSAGFILNFFYLQSLLLPTQHTMRKGISNELKKSFGLSFGDFVVSCQFDAKECTEEDFEWFYEPTFGNCYRFNSNSTNKKYTSKPGGYDGLNVQLFVGIPNNSFSYATRVGARVFIHNNSIEPSYYLGKSFFIGR